MMSDKNISGIDTDMQLIQKKIGQETCTVYAAPYQNLYETLANSARRFPDKKAMIDDKSQVTYSELLQQVDRFASFLREKLKVKKGDRVAVLMTNSINFCVAFYAIIKLGYIVVVINTKQKSAEIEYILCDTQAEIVCADTLWAAELEKAAANTAVRKVIWNGQPGKALAGKESYLFDTVLADNSLQPDSVLPEAGIMQPAVIMYTSGTTGKPKGAVISHYNLLQNLCAYQDILHLDETESTLLSVPAFHITGLGCIMTLFVYIGGLIVLTPFFRPKEALEIMERYRITHYHAVPTVYIMLANAAEGKVCLKDLKTAVCGGGFITNDDIHRFCATAPNTSFHPAYGMTESTGAGALFPDDYRRADKFHAAGKVMPNVEIQIVDEQFRAVPLGVSGQICFRGGTVIRSYWKTERSETFHDGWLASGDVGKLDADGYIYILDRIKDQINRGGEKIYSLVVEEEIRHCSGVRQVAVFGVPDSLYGEVPAAVVVLQDGALLTADDIAESLKLKMAKYKIPRYIEFWDQLPCTASGKVKKYALRQIFQQKYSNQSSTDK